MVIKDKELEDIIVNKTPICINGTEYIVERNPIGSCDECYFLGKTCPMRAVTICCSNGGNILKLKEQNNK